MNWAIDFIETASRDRLPMVRETLDARHQASLGHHAEAARILWELTVHARHASDRSWECITQVHLGKVYRVLRWSIAVKLLDQALATAREMGFDRAAMMALNELGEIRCSWGELAEAVVLLEEALDLVEQHDLTSRRDVLLNLEVAHEGLGNAVACQELLEKVVELDRQLDHADLTEDLEHLAVVERRASEASLDLQQRESAANSEKEKHPED